MPAPQKLTERLIRELPLNGKPYAVRDTKVRGFMVVVNKESKVFKIQRDLWVGEAGRKHLEKTCRITLGSIDELGLEDARTRAMELLARIRRGEDPSARPAVPKSSSSWTVEHMFKQYVADLSIRGCAERTGRDMLTSLESYLADWKPLRISEIKPSMARERHVQITRDNGPVVANHALAHFKTCYQFAIKVADEPLPSNPALAVTWNPMVPSQKVIAPKDLPEWLKKIQALPNPIRKAMHELGLFSGLRPGTLMGLRREWIDLENRVIRIPRQRMKSRRNFDLPLSEHMLGIVRRVLALGDALFPGSEWLFPTRNPNREIIPTAIITERTMPQQTGHILRHTYRTLAQRAGIDTTDARLLLDHKVPGIDGVYIHERALFDRLLAAQERMSQEISSLIGLREEGRSS